MQDRKVVHFRGNAITRQQVLDVMAEYDIDYPNNDYCEPPATVPWQENQAYKYAVVHAGRFYPPKYLAHCLTGRALQGEGLHGGHVNRVFEGLDFEVIRLRP